MPPHFTPLRKAIMSDDPVISVEELTKVYKGDLVAVDHVSFDVNPGGIFALLGANGAGKTTTVEMMEGLRTPTSGSVRVLGVDVTKDYALIRRRVGVLPQEFTPFDRLKAPEAVRYFAALFGKRPSADQVDELISTVGLEDRADTIAMKLSGGEKRRIGIALALVGEPELLFLDEPTTGLDPQARRSLWQLLERLRDEGKTIVLTTHYLEEAEKLADDVAVLHKGKLVSRGSPRELIDHHGGGISIQLEGCSDGASEKVRSLGFQVETGRDGLRVRLPPGGSVRAAIRRLEEGSVPFDDLITLEPTLEDAFLNLVGARMEEGVLKG
jgi:ABC-2 type transport system ATP-binding protein